LLDLVDLAGFLSLDDRERPIVTATFALLTAIPERPLEIIDKRLIGSSELQNVERRSWVKRHGSTARHGFQGSIAIIC
jgi:hypothetical protein